MPQVSAEPVPDGMWDPAFPSTCPPVPTPWRYASRGPGGVGEHHLHLADQRGVAACAGGENRLQWRDLSAQVVGVD